MHCVIFYVTAMEVIYIEIMLLINRGFIHNL